MSASERLHLCHPEPGGAAVVSSMPPVGLSGVPADVPSDMPSDMPADMPADMPSDMPFDMTDCPRAFPEGLLVDRGTSIRKSYPVVKSARHRTQFYRGSKAPSGRRGQ